MLFGYQGEFAGKRRLCISLLTINLSGGKTILFTNNIELKETGEININPYVDYQSYNPNNPFISTHASIMQRYDTNQIQYTYGTGLRSDAWLNTAQAYTTDYKYGSKAYHYAGFC